MNLQKGFAHVAIIALAAVLAGGAGTVAASNSARPGDLLYGVDRAVERVRANLTFGEEAKAELYAKLAQERKGELNSLVNGNAPADRLDQAVRNYGEDVEKALDKAGQLSEEAQQKVLGLVAENALVDQEGFNTALANASEQAKPALERAFATAEANFERARERMSEQTLQQVMERVQSQVQNMDGLLERVQENKPADSGSEEPGSNQNPEAGSGGSESSGSAGPTESRGPGDDDNTGPARQ